MFFGKGWPAELGGAVMDVWWEYRLVFSGLPEVRVQVEERPGDRLGVSAVVVRVWRRWEDEVVLRRVTRPFKYHDGHRWVETDACMVTAEEPVFCPGEEWVAENVYPMHKALLTGFGIEPGRSRRGAEETRRKLEAAADDRGRCP